MPELIIHITNQPPFTHALESGRNTVGRAASNTVQIDDVTVSGRHAEIIRDGDKCTIRDLNSTNGVFVDGEPVSECALPDSCTILIGHVVCLFRPSPAVNPPGVKEPLPAAKPAGEAVAKSLEVLNPALSAPQPARVQLPGGLPKGGAGLLMKAATPPGSPAEPAKRQEAAVEPAEIVGKLQVKEPLQAPVEPAKESIQRKDGTGLSTIQPSVSQTIGTNSTAKPDSIKTDYPNSDAANRQPGAEAIKLAQTQAALNEAEKKIAEMALLHDEIKKQSDKADKLAAKLTVKSAANGDLQQKLSLAGDQAKALREELTKHKEEIAALRLIESSATALKQTHDKVQREHEALRAEKDSLAAARAELQQKLAAAQGQEQALHGELDKAHGEHEVLRAEKDSLAAARAELQQKLAAAQGREQALRGELDKNAETIAALQVIEGNAAALKQAYQRLLDEHDSLEKEKESLESELFAARAALLHLQLDSQQKLSLAQEQEQALRTEIAGNKELIDSLRAAEREANALRDSHDTLLGEHQALNSEYEKLAAEHEDMAAGHEQERKIFCDAQLKAVTTLNQLDELRRELALSSEAKQSMLQQLESAERQKAGDREQIAALRGIEGEAAALKESNNKLISDRQALSVEKRKVEEQLVTARAAIAEGRRELAAAMEQTHAVRNEGARLKEAGDRLLSERDALRTELEKAANEKKELIASREKDRKVISETQANAAAAVGQLESNRKELAKLAEHRDKLLQQLSVMEKQSADYKARLQNAASLPKSTESEAAVSDLVFPNPLRPPAPMAAAKLYWKAGIQTALNWVQSQSRRTRMAGAGATGVLLISLFILMAAHYRDNRVGALTNKAFIGNRQAKAEPIAAPLKIGEFVTPDTKANRHAILVPGKYPTISEAMEAAVDGDVILVGDGEYHESIRFKSGVHLIGSDPKLCRLYPVKGAAAILSGIDCSGGSIENIGFHGDEVVSDTIVSAGWVLVQKDSGVEVKDVEAGGPASNAGLMPGWKIKAINGKVINYAAAADYLLASEAGHEVMLGVESGGYEWVMPMRPGLVHGKGFSPDGLVFIDSTLEVLNCVLEGMAGNGILVMGRSGYTRFEQVISQGNRLAGICIANVSAGDVHKCLFAENGTDGILIVGQQTTAHLSCNVSRGNKAHGMYCMEGAAPFVEDCWFIENDLTGISILEPKTAPRLTRNVSYQNKKHGLSISCGASGEVIDNRFEGNGQSGIAVIDSDTAPVLQKNECIGNNEWGLVVLGGAQPKVSQDAAYSENVRGSIWKSGDPGGILP